MTHKIEIAQDLRANFGAARDQGSRPTCLAFAASDAHAGVRNGWEPLSCEFAFFHAQRRAMRPPSSGALLGQMLAALKLDGQPVEAGWPYLAVTPTQASAWQPPAQPGPLFGRDGAEGQASFGKAIECLDAGKPVVLLLALVPSFFRPDAEGVVVPAVGEVPQPTLRHAVIAVGHGKVDGDPAILVRNSWGSSWGDQGYGWLPQAVVTAGIFALAVLGGDVNVSGYSTAA